jgi:REP element-mobilizing transposase RayT
VPSGPLRGDYAKNAMLVRSSKILLVDLGFTMHSDPLAYFLTFTTYGTWLHGSDSGSVDRIRNQYDFPRVAADSTLQETRQRQLKNPSYALDEPRRIIVLDAIIDVAKVRSWTLWSVHVRTNHIHAIVTADAQPEKVLIDFKAWCSRRLAENLIEPRTLSRWTKHGSTKYLWSDDQMILAMQYVIEQQGKPMSLYIRSSSEPRA